jgi:SGNH hydrolase-like domain, acetyltransferase AlgX
MRRLRSFLAGLLEVAAGVVFLLLVQEVVLRFLPVAWAPPVQAPTATDPIQRYQPNRPFTWSLGWNFYVVVRGRSNAQGFIAGYDYYSAAPQPVVAVVGDSMVEALMVPFAETLTGRLQATLTGKGHAYAIAQSGSPLSQYVAYAAHACAAHRPQRLVAVVVGNDFDESMFRHRQRDGIHHLHPRADGGFDYKLTPLPPPPLIERIARNSALALYLVRNVGVARALANIGIRPAQAAASDRYVGATLADAGTERVAEGEKVIAWFLDALPGAACLAPREIVIVLDAIRPQIYDDNALAAARTSYFGRMRAKLMSEAAARGFIVVDLEGPMRADYAARRQGFEFPTDMHWNAYAHAIAAAAVREALAGWPPLESR